MNAAEEGRQQLDAASVVNARRTLLMLLARAGVVPGDAEELIGLVEAGSLALAHEEVLGGAPDAPRDKGELYAHGWLDGAGAAADALGELAEAALRRALATSLAEADPDRLPPVRKMEVERTQVAVTALYLSFTTASDLDPEVTQEVLTAALGTMDTRQRATYAGRLEDFASRHRGRLERLYAAYGPGGAVAVHGRYSLVHSATSVAVLERLAVADAALREEWDAAELPPAWLDGLTSAWEASG
ncbi:hypothetical protein ACIQUQ_20650 [Streptomyces sp. NPDC101118]|uniref:hypothetical protein n=1 Tax=Streptomyces sp. NPDC101118 TaxID=3366109 RepID=UPI00381F6D87